MSAADSAAGLSATRGGFGAGATSLRSGLEMRPPPAHEGRGFGTWPIGPGRPEVACLPAGEA